MDKIVCMVIMVSIMTAACAVSEFITNRFSFNIKGAIFEMLHKHSTK